MTKLIPFKENQIKAIGKQNDCTENNINIPSKL